MTATAIAIKGLVDTAITTAYDATTHGEDVDAFINELGDFPKAEVDQWWYLEQLEEYEAPEHL